MDVFFYLGCSFFYYSLLYQGKTEKKEKYLSNKSIMNSAINFANIRCKE